MDISNENKLYMHALPILNTENNFNVFESHVNQLNYLCKITFDVILYYGIILTLHMSVL